MNPDLLSRSPAALPLLSRESPEECSPALPLPVRGGESTLLPGHPCGTPTSGRANGPLGAMAGDPADGGQDLRLRLERRIQAADEVTAALDVVELAAAQVHPRVLPAFAERLGRAYSRAMARLAAEQRRAVRAAVGDRP